MLNKIAVSPWWRSKVLKFHCRSSDPFSRRVVKKGSVVSIGRVLASPSTVQPNYQNALEAPHRSGMSRMSDSIAV